ncbi:MAG: glycerophosphodiester phosphodiesterase family protein [Fermentimonas sp.]|nr:glycerophosphodiester phosphodiesterase family protein [Fermentimonas sp.]
MIMIRTIIIFFSLVLLGCTQTESEKVFSLHEFPQDKVMVVAHRGNWREAPENSVWAIRKAIEAGADMAEIDIALTRDSVLILMHDRTIDRTTTGKGMPSDYTLAEIKELYLRDGAGHATQMRVPTLEEILLESKGKIFLNLDKGFDYIGLVYPMLEKYDMLNEVLFKGNSEYKTFNNNYGHIKDEIVYMPIVRLERGEGWDLINDFIENYSPYGFEFTVGENEDSLIDFKPLRDKGIRIWVNSLWYNHNAGNHDDVSLENPNVYEWYINNNVNIIQTDRIKELTSFLEKEGYKN